MELSESSAGQTPRTHSWAIRIFRVLGVILIAGALWMAEWSSIGHFFGSAEFRLALVPLAALIGLALVVSAQALKRGVSIQDWGDRTVYGKVHGYAHLVKAVLQMSIGIIAVVIVGWKFLHAPPPLRPKPDDQTTTTATSLLLDGIGVGLAAAAVVELAYTLFTDGPDEALDPLMLGLSAAILIQLGGLDPHVSFQQAGGLLALGVLLAVLFATRLMLAERHDGEAPKVWWTGGDRSKR